MLSAVFGAESAPPSVELERAALAIAVRQRDFHRQEVRQCRGLRARRRGADILRLHAWRGGRHRGDADGRGRYGIVAVFLYALSRYPALAPTLTGPGGVMAATPAE